jgi:general secretion pathway protein G
MNSTSLENLAKNGLVQSCISSRIHRRTVVAQKSWLNRARKPAANRPRKSERGVTLIEMLVVVVIIGLFVGLVSVNMFKKADDAKRTAARAQISNFSQALGLYKLDTGSFPSTEQGLQALRVKPDSNANTNWSGPYLPQDVPLDPWGRPYLYKYPGDHGDEPDLLSLGGDGQPGGEGNNADIVSWSNK